MIYGLLYDTYYANLDSCDRDTAPDGDAILVGEWGIVETSLNQLVNRSSRR